MHVSEPCVEGKQVVWWCGEVGPPVSHHWSMLLLLRSLQSNQSSLITPPGAKAVNNRSPAHSILSYLLQLVPAVSSSLRVRVKVPAPAVSWSSSLPLPLWIPFKRVPRDVVCRFPSGVTDPAPSPLGNLYLSWSLLRQAPQFFVADSLRPVDPEYLS